MKFSSSLAAVVLAGVAIAADTVLTVEKLVDRVKTVELQRNLYNLNQIAKKNGGNRAFGWPGYDASGEYILERAVTRFGPNFKTYKQYFNHTYEQTRKITLTGPDGEDVYVITSQYNTPTALPGGVFGELVDTPVDDVRGSGCFADQWEGIDVTGKIALVKRGACAIAEKLKLAKAKGALAVVLWNNAPGDNIIGATLQAQNIGLIVPVGTVRLAVGEAWKARLAAGQKLSVRLVVDGFLEIRETFNIISETVEGDPNNVIMIGAHLDSVQAGPGVNDDGSGTSALLEIMTAIRYYKGYRNKIRFGWWGAEESGLVGSTFYVDTLPESELDKIRFYFNYDMIGSINPQYAVYQGTNPADAYGAQGLIDYLKANGKDAYAAPFGTSSDYLAFINNGVPSSGIFTGAGEPNDPCYHLVCDTTANINADALTVNAKAAAFQVGTFALSDLAGLARRTKTTVNPRSKTEQRNQLNKMKREFEHAVEHTHSCDNHAKILV